MKAYKLQELQEEACLDDGAATEISIRRDGEFFGLGVDVEAPAHPLRSGGEGKGGASVVPIDAP